MKVFKPKEMSNGEYGWQSSYAEGPNESYTVPSFIWEMLIGTQKCGCDGGFLFKTYKDKAQAVMFLKMALSHVARFSSEGYKIDEG